MKFFCFLFLIFMLAATSAQDWQAAPRGYEVTFPKDHGQHPAQRIEWWYFTGNVATADGQAFGYQLTFFRIGTEFQPANPSAWAVRDLHMAHLAISDFKRGKYYCAQRLGRAGPGLAGAARETMSVWNGKWKAQFTGPESISLEAQGAQDGEEFSLQLRLSTKGPLVLHGDAGYSRKGQQEGNASIYYSLTRAPTEGVLQIDGVKFPVQGNSWMDHEFGSSFLEAGQAGWDWFALQLDDGSDLMVYRIRNLLPDAPAHLSGTLVGPDGTATPLTGSDVILRGSETWKSQDTGASYPLQWDLALPHQEGSLRVTTKLAAQEMHGGKAGPSYWEGAVEAAGKLHGRPVRGVGYLEMTGYSGGMAQFFTLGQ
jgi:predicted secreted hydrolase